MMLSHAKRGLVTVSSAALIAACLGTGAVAQTRVEADARADRDSVDVDVDVNLGGRDGATGEANVRAGRGDGADANARLDVGGSDGITGRANVGAGGGGGVNADACVGIGGGCGGAGGGPGTGGPGAGGPGMGGPGTGQTMRALAALSSPGQQGAAVAAFRNMDRDDQIAMLTACQAVLASPGSYERGMVALCRLLQRIAMR